MSESTDEEEGDLAAELEDEGGCCDDTETGDENEAARGDIVDGVTDEDCKKMSVRMQRCRLGGALTGCWKDAETVGGEEGGGEGLDVFWLDMGSRCEGMRKDWYNLIWVSIENGVQRAKGDRRTMP